MTVSEFINQVGFKVNQGDIDKVNGSINGIKNSAAKALGALGIGLSIAGVTQFIKECVAIGSEVEEMQNKFNVVFDGMQKEMESWASKYANTIGRSANDIKAYVADSQDLLVGFMGPERRAEAAELSKNMTTLALDLASFSNVDESAAVNYMTKAVLGETEAAKMLGVALDDNTRKQAMNTLGIEGSYDALDQATKMMVNYQAIVNQSGDAIGDCERSQGSYRSTLIRFQSTLKDLKTMIGQFFMPAIQKILLLGSKGVLILQKVVKKFTEFADAVGGSEVVLAAFAATFATVFAAKKIDDIRAIAKAVIALGKSFFMAGLKMLPLYAGFLLLFAIIKDVANFMNGKDSFIGDVFKKAGIDAEEARAKIRDAWNGIKDAVTTAVAKVATIVANLGTVFASISDGLSSVFAWVIQHQGALTALAVAFGVVAAAIVAMNASAIASKASLALLGAQIGLLTLKETLYAVATKGAALATTLFGAAFKFLTSPITLVIAAIAAVIAIGVLLYKNWDTVKAHMIQAAQAIWTAITQAVTGIFTVVSTIFSAILAFVISVAAAILSAVISAFQRMVSAVRSAISTVYNTIVSGFNAAVSFIRGLAGQAFSWGADIISNIVSGIRSRIGNIISAASDIASTIRSYLHFTVPDTGPLSDFDTYMPDMINLMTSGMNAGRRPVARAASALAGTMNRGLGFIGANRGTIAGMVGGLSKFASSGGVSSRTMSTARSNSINKSVVQNVEINNQFNGEKAIQKQAASTMKQSANDVTALLARGLAYAR